jgi:guanylate kinase
VEWAEVHDHRYGTLKRELEAGRGQGGCVILEIDVQGARQVRRQYPDCLMIFLKAPSPEEYERRLRLRRTESEADLQRRLAGARQELACAGEYDVEVINDRLEDAVRSLREILQDKGGCRAG